MNDALTWLRGAAVSLAVAAFALGISCGGDEGPHSAGEREDAAAKISDTALAAQMVRIQTAVRQYRAMNGSVPQSVQDLVDEGLVTASSARDPWGHPWIIVAGAEVQILSYGADGKPGGSGPDRDRTSP